MSVTTGSSDDYVIRVFDSPARIEASDWDALLATQDLPTPFMRHAYLSAMHDSGSAVPDTGWTPRFITLWRGKQLDAACALYLKDHSYGEYVFDWAWARAYAQNGLDYYPKAVVAPPFTPVPGSRLLARDDAARTALVRAAVDWCAEQAVSSLHLLFASPRDLACCEAAGLMLRHTVQFHWRNEVPAASGVENDPGLVPAGRSGGFADFDDFLSSLSQDKRKKVRQERRKVAQAGVRLRALRGREIEPRHWDFFYSCYERTYWEHGNAPYLTPAFFQAMRSHMPDNWLLFLAEHGDEPVGCSLVAIQDRVAYGRYWGALRRVDCLHFEACYHAPIEWCIANGFERFEGGAQGEHKMARALMPVRTSSAHWLAHPGFADAVERFLTREEQAIDGYMDELRERSPFRRA